MGVYAVPAMRTRTGRTFFSEYSGWGNLTRGAFLHIVRPENVLHLVLHMVQPRLGKLVLEIPSDVLVVQRLEGLFGEPFMHDMTIAARDEDDRAGSGFSMAWAEEHAFAWRKLARVAESIAA